jgi:hypothetical protein
MDMLRKSEVAVVRALPSGLGNSAAVWGAIATGMQDLERKLYRQ